MTSTHLAGFVLCAFLAACGGHRAATGDDARTRLKQQADAWDRAIVAKDRAAIAANMASDFRQTGSDGRAADKRRFIDAITSERLTIAPYTVDDFDIRLYGDTALLTGTTRMQGSYAGKPYTTHYRFTDVYVKSVEGWKVVSVQTTEIAE